jgi:hypothetical protein
LLRPRGVCCAVLRHLRTGYLPPSSVPPPAPLPDVLPRVDLLRAALLRPGGALLQAVRSGVCRSGALLRGEAMCPGLCRSGALLRSRGLLCFDLRGQHLLPSPPPVPSPLPDLLS